MRYLFTILLQCALSNSFSQTPGCTDPQAGNYNNAANLSDGSCVYNLTPYNPTLKAALTNTLTEISGIVFFNGNLLALNDGGGGNKLYVLDSSNGNIIQTIVVTGATNIDWEDIAQDSSYIYVADAGNNAQGNRKDLCIYKINKTAFLPAGDFAIPASAVEKINFVYPDQTDFSPLNANSTRYDCEAVTIARGQLHLFTKNWIGNYSVHYKLPVVPGTYTAAKLDSFDTGGFLITGADAGAYDELIFTAYNHSGDCRMYLVFGFDTTDMFFNSGNKRSLQLPFVQTSGQVESICFVNATHGFIANEKFSKNIFTVTNKLSTFTTDQWITGFYRNKPSIGEKGMLRYNSTTDKYEVFTGINWESLN